MKILSIQEAYKRKFAKQSEIDGLEFHASGHCVHVGKISPGCIKCFLPDKFSSNFEIGSKCNCKCVYCYGLPGRVKPVKRLSLDKKGQLFQKALKADCKHGIPSISFSGGGDPLFYLDTITAYMNFYRNIEKDIKIKPWYYLYSNGIRADLDTILRLKDLGFDEIRFHLGASNFSKEVYENMAESVRHINTITVETPAWPPHRESLFKMLPIIEDIGVKHLNIGQVVITPFNKDKIFKFMPDAEVFQCYYMHLDDGGLVYDIVEEVLRNNYSFSILDCSCFVKSIQRSYGKWIMHESIKGLCYKY